MQKTLSSKCIEFKNKNWAIINSLGSTFGYFTLHSIAYSPHLKLVGQQVGPSY